MFSNLVMYIDKDEDIVLVFGIMVGVVLGNLERLLWVGMLSI
jgi:hypothetical protein